MSWPEDPPESWIERALERVIDVVFAGVLWAVTLILGLAAVLVSVFAFDWVRRQFSPAGKEMLDVGLVLMVLWKLFNKSKRDKCRPAKPQYLPLRVSGSW
jgi:hypothetical protein